MNIGHAMTYRMDETVWVVAHLHRPLVSSNRLVVYFQMQPWINTVHITGVKDAMPVFMCMCEWCGCLIICVMMQSNLPVEVVALA